jgi:rod shape-determining protein MreD
MFTPIQRPIAVYRVHPVAFWTTVLLSLLLYAVLPLKLPVARHFDFPLLVIVYYGLVRRDLVYSTLLGAGLGLVQDAMAHGFIGFHGMANSLAGYLAAAAGVRFDPEQLLPRTLLTGLLVLVHDLSVLGLRRALLESSPPFEPLDVAVSVMVNVALGLVLFQFLDRFKQAT